MAQAKSSFMSNREPIGAGDYLLKKKKQASKNCCVSPPKKPQYKYNLNMNLFTTLDLSYVGVVEDHCHEHMEPPLPTTINKVAASNFYKNYVIDPNGKLFGNSPCGYNSFLLYLKDN